MHTNVSPRDNEDVEWRWESEMAEHLKQVQRDRARGERLASAAGSVLSFLPLHLERVVRDHFGFTPNPQLEDVSPGALADALHILSRSDVCESLREFV